MQERIRSPAEAQRRSGSSSPSSEYESADEDVNVQQDEHTVHTAHAIEKDARVPTDTAEPAESRPRQDERRHEALILALAGSDTLASKHSFPPESVKKDGLALAVEVDNAPPATPSPFKQKKTAAFWLVIISLALCEFLAALDLTAISTALPTIARELGSDSSTWVGSSFALSSTAFQPVFGGLANVWGRKANMLGSVAIFAVGSAMCGAAPNMDLMIAGRTVQGVGAGGILILSEIIVADLVPLDERGLFFGLLALVWAAASGVGPVLGGALAASNYRWLFYMNLPIAALSLTFVSIFMNLKVPSGSFTEKLRKVDWMGSFVFTASATLIILGLSFGGEEPSWISVKVLLPLILGGVLLLLFLYVEKRCNMSESSLLRNDSLFKFARPDSSLRTVQSHNSDGEHTHAFNGPSDAELGQGYWTTFIHGAVSIVLIYYLPAYFQGVKGRSPVQAGIDFFPTAFLIAPFAIIAGISVAITQHYLVQNLIGWALTVAGFGLLLLYDTNSSTAEVYGLQATLAVGIGIVWAVTAFAVVAPLPLSLNAQAMAFHSFSRSFAQCLGVTMGSVIIMNEASMRMPVEYLSSLPHGAPSVYGAIPEIKNLTEPLLTEVRDALSDSLRVVWLAMLGISGAGFLCSFLIKNLPLESETDESWAIKERQKRATVESQAR